MEGGYRCGCHGTEHEDGCPDCEAGVPGSLNPECSCYRGVGTTKVKLRRWTKNEDAAVKRLMGVRCAVARKALGLSQRELARQMGMSASWVREYEGGAQWPPWWLVLALAEESRQSVQWFLGVAGEPRDLIHGLDVCARCGHRLDPAGVVKRPINDGLRMVHADACPGFKNG